MKLLLDQNLSRRLIGILAAEYPETKHVLLLGMGNDDDTDIWDFAASNGYAIVSKDKHYNFPTTTSQRNSKIPLAL